MTVTVHLVRHGRTASYEQDAGLTDLGVEQARDRAQALAGLLRGGERVDLVHAPTRRARRTAEVIGETLASESARSISLRFLGADEGFANVRVLVGGRAWEPTQVRAEHRRLAALPGPHPGWVTEASRFWQADAVPGGAMTFWLTTPLLWHESPAEVVLRLLGAARRRATASDAGTRVIATTHSGSLRALIAWVSGSDPGEPANAEEVTLVVEDDLVTVGFRGEQWQARYPTDPARWSA